MRRLREREKKPADKIKDMIKPKRRAFYVNNVRAKGICMLNREIRFFITKEHSGTISIFM